MNRLASALHRLTSRLLLLQWFGNVALFLLAAAWLQIPDSHAWQFALSVASGLALVIGFLWLHARTFQILRRHSAAPHLLRRLALLLAVIVVGYFLLRSVGAIVDRGGLLAGYWNSRLSPGMRTFFTYHRIVGLIDFGCRLLEWLLVSLLLPLAFEAGASGFGSASWRRIGRVYRKIVYWVVTVATGFVAAYIVRELVAWTPGTGLRQEAISAVLRIGLAYTVCILLWCLVLGLIAACSPREASESAPS